MLLAMLSSLLPHPIPDEASLLDALAECNGDVPAAARFLQSRSQASPRSSTLRQPSKKRKRSAASLDQWLRSPLPPTSSTISNWPGSSNHNELKNRKLVVKSESNDDTPSSSSSSSTIPKPQIDLKYLLKSPPSKGPPTTPRLAPLILSSPRMVAEHTPCTLHYSVLPPELACELFYTMRDAARSWDRNKWWLFDRLVESSHRTSFFARVDELNGHNENDKKETGTENWKEAARFWCALAVSVRMCKAS